ncbi:methylated-DNA--[protein]-cysteine S-methyltransferase [Halobaculum sp. D14]|uniref:methylated-DNA--[protein]-cysteine S-methyltransferase n=1 Tax=Halobaculum sp. D14 TaxID=3421642 RepID=UPI003EBF4928
MQADVLGDTYDIDESVLGVSAAALRRQLREYETGDRRTFDVDVAFPDGLLGDVMRAMAAIPYGETRTYGELASEVGSAAQAVGQACGANPVPVVVPCHRVVGASSLGGFSAHGGVDAKRALLAFERGESLDAF